MGFCFVAVIAVKLSRSEWIHHSLSVRRPNPGLRLRKKCQRSTCCGHSGPVIFTTAIVRAIRSRSESSSRSPSSSSITNLSLSMKYPRRRKQENTHSESIDNGYSVRAATCHYQVLAHIRSRYLFVSSLYEVWPKVKHLLVSLQLPIIRLISEEVSLTNEGWRSKSSE